MEGSWKIWLRLSVTTSAPALAAYGASFGVAATSSSSLPLAIAGAGGGAVARWLISLALGCLSLSPLIGAHAGTFVYGWSGDDGTGVFRVWPSPQDSLIANCRRLGNPGLLLGTMTNPYGPGEGNRYEQNCNTSAAGCYGDPCAIRLSTSKMHKCEPNGYWAFIEFWPEPDFALNACGRPPLDPEKSAGPPPCGAGVGNPINPAYGNKYQEEVDYAGAGLNPLRLARTYNSQAFIPPAAIGNRWRTTYDRRLLLTAAADSASVSLYRHDGRTLRFSFRANGNPVPLTTSDTSARWVADADVSDQLTRLADAGGNTTGWKYYVAATEETETYDSVGKLTAIASRAGLLQTLTYDGQGRLAAVADLVGRTLTFGYDTKNLIASMLDPAGGLYQYAYDSIGNLSTVTYPDQHQRSYSYNEVQHTDGAIFPSALTGITDELGQRFATFSYEGTQGNAAATEHAGVERYTVANYTTATSLVTDPLGTQRVHSFANVLGVLKCTGVSQPCSNCGGSNASAATYDGNGNVSSRTDFNSKKTCYAYDLARNLETARVEGLSSSESCSTALASPPGRPDVRQVATAWDPNYRLPATIVEPAPGGNKITTFTYDSANNLTQKSVTGPKNDGSGGSVNRRWNWTYLTLGRLEYAIDPNQNATHYEYYADDDPSINNRRNLKKITNPLGHVTQFADYDAHGRPLSIADHNGLVTTFEYAPRGWLKRRTAGAESTSYDYFATGLLQRVTMPDGSMLTYTYDAAHRLTRITDGIGNSIEYTLDAMGNRTREDVKDQTGVLARTRSRVFDELNRLAEDLDAARHHTDYAYDNNGNLRTSIDPRQRQTINTYDALNRLLTVTDPAQGVTRYDYDAGGSVSQVTDPRNVATVYTYDGLGDLIRQESPDAGTTVQTYDAAGHLATKVDGRGVTAIYTSDELNRVRRITYVQAGFPTETHVFDYDVGANAKGRLTKVTDPAAITQWSYNGQGRVASKSQQVGSLIQTVTYGYNSAGQVKSVTTPSGQVLGYSYFNNRIVGIAVNGSPLVSGVMTTPFGPIGAWHWANGLYTDRFFDQDGRLTEWEFRNGASVLHNTLTWDRGWLTQISDPANAALQGNYDYDNLDRLTLARRGAPVTSTQQFSYDAVGNRQTHTYDGGATTLTYGAANNQLTGLTGVLTVDPLHGDMGRTYTYNLANRLVQVQNDSATLGTYHVNALGQRVAKTVGVVVTRFVYDEQGRLLGEYDNSGALVQETVWLEDLPIATLRPHPGSTSNPVQVDVYYVHADHLGTPRAVTRPSDNAITWQWEDLEPFGANLPDEQPTRQSSFSYNLRFPGQYYDAETGTHYNYYRDYDPTIGRYIESDPIGLKGGLNTYGYARSAPLLVQDPTGLDTYVCTRPLAGFGGIRFGRLFHEYICVWDDRTGAVSCGGIGPTGSMFGSASKLEVDELEPPKCRLVRGNDPCYESCVRRELAAPLPEYDVRAGLPTANPGAEQCQVFARRIIRQCRSECSK